MICHEVKGGTGTASRLVIEHGTRYVVAMTKLFRAAAEATEEAILNAL